MSKDIKWGIFGILWSCLFIPMVFLIISLFTRRWEFFFWSLLAAFQVGIPCGIITYQQYKKEKINN
ncbi:hypothetical protein [Caldifermentibacillus hisashii]|uniref:hypothetical protein n=1 Tax=Caldifermentibacillus hisashii TaxID=996558 RepID=UPI0031012580